MDTHDVFKNPGRGKVRLKIPPQHGKYPFNHFSQICLDVLKLRPQVG